MQIDLAVLKKLPISDSAAHVVDGNFDRLPPLIIDRSLTTLKGDFVKDLVARAEAGFRPVAETITMPRRGFGPRPITITDPATRTLFQALVQRFSDDIEPSRTDSRWTLHDELGRPFESDNPWEDEKYLVTLDIASCYEYVDHSILRGELISRTTDVLHAGLVAELLGELYPTGRGLPQLLSASDRLADAYLDVMERRLVRIESRLTRYADDFKAVADDWGRANELIEEGAEAARQLGLVLSTEKTRITKFSTMAARESAVKTFFAKYFEAAGQEVTLDALFAGPYVVDHESIADLATRNALEQVLREWVESRGEDLPYHAQLIPVALQTLADADDRLDDSWLTAIVFLQPYRLESVVRYLAQRYGRDPLDATWDSLSALVRMPRQTPWAKLWLLSGIESAPWLDGPGSEKCSDWVVNQLKDRHEVVRAEAGWVAASFGAVGEAELTGLYRDASAMSRHAIAATCGRAQLSPDTGLVKAATGDTRLASKAFVWGQGIGLL